MMRGMETQTEAVTFLRMAIDTCICTEVNNCATKTTNDCLILHIISNH